MKLDVVDWDSDGRLDLLVNSENATWYRNVADRDGKVVLKKIGNLARRNVSSHTTSPTACDFDQDGKPDLVLGAENGLLYFIEHDNCIHYSKKKYRLGLQRLRAGQDFLAYYTRSLYSRKRTFLSVMPQLSVRHHEGLSSPGLVARENGILMLASGQATTTVEAGRHHKNRLMEFSMKDYGIPAGTRCSTSHQVTGRRCCSSKLAQPLHAGGVNLSLATMEDVPFATVDDCLKASMDQCAEAITAGGW